MADPLDFGRFQVFEDQRELRVDGRPVPLGGRAFDVLLALVQRRDRLVSKAELMDAAWPGVVVEENNLQVQISALRKVLGPQVIVTVAGRGYKFAGSPVAGAPAAATSVVRAVDPLPPASGQRLLVVDDNKVNRLLLARSLQRLGHDVVSVDDGRKALDLLGRERFDLLLLDLEMPEADGFTVLERMAADAELMEVPVIVTSSVEGVDQVARCIELGADDYLHKPVSPVLLKARVGTSLERRRLRVQQRELIARLRAAAERAGPAGVAPPGDGVADAVAGRPRYLQATVLAAQIGDPAPASSMRAPQDAMDLLDSAATLLREAVAGHGGRLVLDNGDAALAVFGLGGAVADGALAATRAALEMLEMLEVFNAERETAEQAPALALSIGIAAGDLLVGPAGPPLAPRFVCVGEAVQRAQALQARGAAAGRDVLVDIAVQTALDGRIGTEPLQAAATTRRGAPQAVFAVRTS